MFCVHATPTPWRARTHLAATAGLDEVTTAPNIAGAGTPACEGERHGITAVTVTSTTHSGRASESMTSPVEA